MRILPLALGAAALIGCTAGAEAPMAQPAAAARTNPAHAEGRLTARPTAPTNPSHEKGLVSLGLASPRDALLFVPSGYTPGKPAPLIVILHGAGGDAPGALKILGERAEKEGAILLAPPSRGATWDVLRGGFGPDVRFLDEALRATFARYAVDPHRITLAGFSDGASYALSLGLPNGDLFDSIVAFSPGFAAPPAEVGKPRVFISHGDGDRVLPIGPCSRTIVPELQAAGYEVEFAEFDGGHSVPAPITRRAIAWLQRPIAEKP